MMKRLIWSAVIAAAWCLSMIHAEHVGMREQAAKDRVVSIKSGNAIAGADGAIYMCVSPSNRWSTPTVVGKP